MKKEIQELKHIYIIDQKKNRELRGKLKNLKEVISCFSMKQENDETESTDPFEKMMQMF